RPRDRRAHRRRTRRLRVSEVKEVHPKATETEIGLGSVEQDGQREEPGAGRRWIRLHLRVDRRELAPEVVVLAFLALPPRLLLGEARIVRSSRRRLCASGGRRRRDDRDERQCGPPEETPEWPLRTGQV